MSQGTGQRGGAGTEGLRGNRAQRSGPPDRDRDLGTEIEDEMRSSGRNHLVPREGLVGAHEQRREAMSGDPDDRMREPPGRGADVAPTSIAEARERERHARQRQLGVVPAGTEGALRQRRDQPVSRQRLNGSGADADEQKLEDQLYEEQEALEAAADSPASWRERAGVWLNQHRSAVAIVAGGAVLAAVGFMTAARVRH